MLPGTDGTIKQTLDKMSNLSHFAPTVIPGLEDNEDFNDTLLPGNMTFDEWQSYFQTLNVVTQNRIWPFFFWITFVVGMCGNVIVVYVFLRSKKPGRNRNNNNITNIYLLNLALGDLLYLISTIPSTSYWSDYWPFGDFMCKLISYLRFVSMTVGVLTLTAVGLDRHSAILNAVASRDFRTVPKAIVVVVCTWLASLAVCSPSLSIARDINVLGDHVCLNYWQPLWGHKVYSLTMFLILYLVPQGILAVCYFRISRFLWFTESLTGASLTKNRRRRRMVKMVVMVTVAFAICWLPIHMVELYIAFAETFSRMFYEIKLLAPLVPHLFIATNPIMYCFMSKTFRAHFKAAFVCRKMQQLPVLSMEDHDFAGSRRLESQGGRKSRGCDSQSDINDSNPPTNHKNIQTDSRSAISRSEERGKETRGSVSSTSCVSSHVASNTPPPTDV